MTTLIQTIATWLTTYHTVTMMGWMWLIAAPLALLLVLAAGAFLFAVVFFWNFQVWR